MVFADLGRAGVRLIERILRRYYDIVPVNDAPDCIVGIGRDRSRHDLVLADGTAVRAGDPLLVLHFWNERLHAPVHPVASASAAILHGGRTNFGDLAKLLQNRPEYAGVRALRADIGFIPDARLPQAQRLAALFGFSFVPGERPGWHILRPAFWQNLFSYWLLWTYNPAALATIPFAQLRRCEIWMSRAQFLARYGRDRVPAPELPRHRLAAGAAPASADGHGVHHLADTTQKDGDKMAPARARSAEE